MYIRDVILLIATIFFTAKALRNPLVGMLAYIGYGIISPQGLTWYFASELPHSMLIALATIIGFIFSHRRSNFPWSREIILLGILWLWFGLSTLFAYDQDSAWDKYGAITKVLFMTGLCMAIFKTRSDLHLAVRVIALSIGFYAVKGAVFFVLTAGEGTVEGSPRGFLFANNALGLALAMNVPLLVYLLGVEENKWMRRLVWLMLLCSYPATIGTFSRGAWVALAAVTGVIILRSKHRFIVMGVFAILLMIGVSLFPLLASSRLTERAQTFENIQDDGSAQQRFGSWEFCARVGLGNPVFGLGFDYYSLKVYEEYYPEYVERWGMERWKGKAWSCHSMWMTVLGEHGVLAFALWIGLLVSCFMKLQRIKAVGRSRSELSWYVPWAEAIQASFLGFIVAGTFLDMAYFEVYYQLVAVIVILSALQKEESSQLQANSSDAVALGLPSAKPTSSTYAPA